MSTTKQTSEAWQSELKPAGSCCWEIPAESHPGMRVPGVVYASEALLPAILQDQALDQVIRVAQLPGIVGASMAMPDIHWGYGFAIGGVAAFDLDEGVISPGGVGYDINCGVRMVNTNLTRTDIQPRLKDLLNVLYRQVPAGVGSEGKIRLKSHELKRVLEQGSAWALGQGYGWAEDLERTEDHGRISCADPEGISSRALERGSDQLGTLGSGNHFLEIQAVETIYDQAAADVLNLHPGQITVMIHCGSRGLGYQVCDDYLSVCRQAANRYAIALPDRQLACAPVGSSEGQAYLGAMSAAANYAWANRQCIMHWVRESFEQVFRQPAEKLGMHLLYDVAHNIAKLETHTVEGKDRTLCVHRKGATRAFPPQHPDVAGIYRGIGQPVLIPGSMGTASYIAVGAAPSMHLTFGSTAHGAGRLLSRKAAVRQARGRSIPQEMEQLGIQVMARDRATLAEETPEAYKDIDEVMEAVECAGLSKKVARMVPLGVVKG